MAASQKAVVNLVFDKNVIKHTHPEVIQNIDDIADLSASLLSAFTAISANEIAISAIQNDILQISGDINYISAVVSGFEADIKVICNLLS